MELLRGKSGSLSDDFRKSSADLSSGLSAGCFCGGDAFVGSGMGDFGSSEPVDGDSQCSSCASFANSCCGKRAKLF